MAQGVPKRVAFAFDWTPVCISHPIGPLLADMSILRLRLRSTMQSDWRHERRNLGRIMRGDAVDVARRPPPGGRSSIMLWGVLKIDSTPLFSALSTDCPPRNALLTTSRDSIAERWLANSLGCARPLNWTTLPLKAAVSTLRNCKVLRLPRHRCEWLSKAFLELYTHETIVPALRPIQRTV